MPNWQYAAKLPTSPWRGQMAYPRSLALERTADGIRLVQNPVREIEALRGERTQMRDQPVAKAAAMVSHRDWPTELEIVAELKPQASQDIGIELRKGPDQATRVGYDARKGVVYIDRTRSGVVSVSPDFPARHEAPLGLRKGAVALHILLDRCSVEVYADGGQVTLTDLIFPQPGDRGLSLYDVRGQASVISLDVWGLKK